MSENPKFRCRRCRFSLRTMFVSIGLVAICMGWVAHERSQSRHELEFAEQLRAEGATVQFAGPFDPRIPEKAPWWRSALGDLFGARIFRIVDNYSRSLTDLTRLTELKSLTCLCINGTRVSDLSPLADVKNLQYLHLGNTPIKDLSPLVELKHLWFLDLDDTLVSDASLHVGLESLNVLVLDRTQVTDLSPLIRLINLEMLSLRGTRISDLSPLAGLKSLRELHVENTDAVEEQIKLLQQALPNCTIYR